MKTKFTLLAVLGLFAAGATLAADEPAAQVEVSFFEPENYTDANADSFDNERGRAYVLLQLKEHILLTAPRYLAPGQQLEINVTNVDLAGGFEPGRRMDFDHIRMVREIYPPRLTLQFRLRDAAGNVVSSGKRDLQDLSFMTTISLPTSDPLRYDKGMISDWIRREFRRSG